MARSRTIRRIRGFSRDHSHALLLTLVVLAMCAQTLYELVPPHLYSADLQYVKAKVVQVMEGHLLMDPVSGYQTFHPPFFHIILAPFRLIGLPWSWLLLLVSLVDISLLTFFTYRLVTDLYGRTAALCTAAALPFVIQFMGVAQPLLPTAFYFSISFYLAGLWLYLKAGKTTRRSLSVGILWGVAFLISPSWFFLIGFTFLYDLLIVRDYRRSAVTIGAFLAMMIPFVVQAWILYQQHLHTAGTFAFWRGFPGWSFWSETVPGIIAPTGRPLESPGPIIHLCLLAAFAIIVVRSRRIHWYVVVSFAAYLFTLYHFSLQYAIRMQLFFSIFVVARLARSVAASQVRTLGFAAVVGLAAYGVYDHAVVMHKRYRADNFLAEKLVRTDFVPTLQRLTEPGDFILATKSGYLYHVAAEVPVHALGAYKTLDYFQVPPRISEAFEANYQRMIWAPSYDDLRPILDSFQIEVAVFTHIDIRGNYTVKDIIRRRWPKAYDDGWVMIYQRPADDLRRPTPRPSY